MSLTPKLAPALRQRLTLTPGVRLGLDVLRKPGLELSDALSALAERNPFIRLSQSRPIAPPMLAEAVMAAQQSPHQNLIDQINMMRLGESTARIARFLVSELDENGYLTTPLSSLAALLDCSEKQVGEALRCLQCCEPTGVGAQSLAQCIELQLIDRGIAAETAQAACANLNAIVAENWAKAARATGIDKARLVELASTIRELNPRPLAATPDSTITLIADLRVERALQGTFHVAVNHSALPRMQVDSALAAQISADDALLQAQRREAEDWAAALAFRNKTLLRISEQIVQRQYIVFEKGAAHMPPLSRAQLAQEIGLHPTTVGRAVYGKGLEFGGAVWPLTAFLSNPLGTGAQSSHSAYAVQHRIRAMIAAEDKANPMPDDQIVRKLADEGVDISRRTVAKYRGCLKLPSSYYRKRRN